MSKQADRLTGEPIGGRTISTVCLEPTDNHCILLTLEALVRIPDPGVTAMRVLRTNQSVVEGWAPMLCSTFREVSVINTLIRRMDGRTVGKSKRLRMGNEKQTSKGYLGTSTVTRIDAVI